VKISELSASQNIMMAIDMLRMDRSSAVRGLSSTDSWCEIAFPFDASTFTGGRQSAKKIPQHEFNGWATDSQRRITI
jgi:hypothetical protein